jgi:hypothetical protein
VLHGLAQPPDNESRLQPDNGPGIAVGAWPTRMMSLTNASCMGKTLLKCCGALEIGSATLIRPARYHQV